MKTSDKDGLWIRTRNEIEKVEAILSVWLIMKDGQIKGRITARWTKTRTMPIMRVTFIFYATNEYGMPIYGYEKVQGFGFDMTNTGIANILLECRKPLKEHYGVELDTFGWKIMNNWKHSFESAGFTIIQAI